MSSFDRIIEAIRTLNHEFRIAGLKPPAAIELASRDDGDRLRMMAPRDLVGDSRFVKVDAQTGLLANECQICGTVVRWPGKGP
jgi:hypothetical protein